MTPVLLLFSCVQPDDVVLSVADLQQGIQLSQFENTKITALDVNQDGQLQHGELTQASDASLAEIYNALVSQDGKTFQTSSSVARTLQSYVDDSSAKGLLIKAPTPAIRIPAGSSGFRR